MTSMGAFTFGFFGVHVTLEDLGERWCTNTNSPPHIYTQQGPEVDGGIVVDNLELAREGLLASGDPLVDVGGDRVAHNKQVESHQPPEQPIDLRDGSDSKNLVDF